MVLQRGAVQIEGPLCGAASKHHGRLTAAEFPDGDLHRRLPKLRAMRLRRLPRLGQAPERGIRQYGDSSRTCGLHSVGCRCQHATRERCDAEREKSARPIYHPAFPSDPAPVSPFRALLSRQAGIQNLVADHFINIPKGWRR